LIINALEDKSKLAEVWRGTCTYSFSGKNVPLPGDLAMRSKILLSSFAVLTVVLLLFGCNNKERIVESTQYVHDITYQTDTINVYHTDTVFRGNDTVRVYSHDTVRVTDTARIHDTVRVTVTVHDTVTTIKNHYDTLTVTVTVHDTIVKPQWIPTQQAAIVAMQVQTDPQVLQFANEQFGETSGWVFYNSPAQMTVTKVSTGVYDIGAYVDYWTTDFAGYYPLEVAWRMTYKSGDPSIATNWTMADPPAVQGMKPGISIPLGTAPARQLQRPAR
jgi:hypothetical protein